MASFITPMVIAIILIAIVLIVASVAILLIMEMSGRPEPDQPAQQAWASSSAFELPPKDAHGHR